MADIEADRHRARMQRKKAVAEGKQAAATIERGVLVVHTGNGKGKSSAAFGMVARALGHAMRVGVVQFIKGPRPSGEMLFFSRIAEVELYAMGEGFTWEVQDRERDLRAAAAAWRQATALLSRPELGLVVLDELNIALKHRYLALDEVLATLQRRPPMQHVVITGRGAPPALIAAADTVSEARLIKHAFAAGVRAQKGVEL